jgi:hypothetical protein
VPHPHYSSAEITQRGPALHARQLRQKAFLRWHLGSAPSGAPQRQPATDTPRPGYSRALRAGRLHPPECIEPRAGVARRCSPEVGHTPQDVVWKDRQG